MENTIFALVSEWRWDHSNVEMATIILENYEFDSIGGIENLSPSCMPPGLISSIEKVRNAQDRSIMGENEPVALYLVTNEPELFRIYNRLGEKHEITFCLEPICKFDKEGKPMPF